MESLQREEGVGGGAPLGFMDLGCGAEGAEVRLRRCKAAQSRAPPRPAAGRSPGPLPPRPPAGRCRAVPAACRCHGAARAALRRRALLHRPRLCPRALAGLPAAGGAAAPVSVHPPALPAAEQQQAGAGGRAGVPGASSPFHSPPQPSYGAFNKSVGPRRRPRPPPAALPSPPRPALFRPPTGARAGALSAAAGHILQPG